MIRSGISFDNVKVLNKQKQKETYANSEQKNNVAELPRRRTGRTRCPSILLWQ
jgi:hypothetical protein